MSSDNDKNAYIALVLIDDLELADLSRDEVVSKLLNIALEFCDSVTTRLGSDDSCYFVLRANSNLSRAILLNPKGSGPYANKERVHEEIIGEKDANFGIEHQEMCLCFITEGSDHWDYNFLELNDHFSRDFTVIGPHPSHGDFARQIYSNGDFDTGVEAVGESIDQYVGVEMLTQAGLSKDFFSLANYP